MVQPEITVRYEGRQLRVASGTTVAEVLRSVHGTLPDELLAALVNRRMVMLDFPLRGLEVSLEAVLLGSREGEGVARRSASLLLLEAVHLEFPDVRQVVGQSLGGGYFYRWLGEPGVSAESVAAVGRRMTALCDEDRAIVRRVITLENAEAIFRSTGDDRRRISTGCFARILTLRGSTPNKARRRSSGGCGISRTSCATTSAAIPCASSKRTPPDRPRTLRWTSWSTVGWPKSSPRTTALTAAWAVPCTRSSRRLA